MRVLALLAAALASHGCGHDSGLPPAATDAGSTAADLTLNDFSVNRSPDLDETCGGFRGAPCEPGWFCDYPDRSCGIADQTGICVEQPELCFQEFDPVCGCDHQTHYNDCARRARGVALAYDGVCGCAESCAVGLWCAECVVGYRCVTKGMRCS